MLDTENMQIVYRLLAFTLDRWCPHRAARKEQSVAYTPPEVLPPIPLVRIGYQHFTFQSILPAQALEERTPP